MKYAVTGSTGAFGTLAIKHLLELNVPASSIIALARSPEKAAKFEEGGVEVRIADYDRLETLEGALAGAERLLLVSGSEVGKRLPQHRNVLSAAKKAGVKLIVYTSISNADDSVSPLAPEHKATEKMIKESGIPFVFMRNNWYTENYTQDVALAGKTGVIEAATGTGKVASASRTDYAEGAVRVLKGDGHENKIYELCGEPWDYNGLAKAASEVLGKPVVYKAVTPDERTQSLLAAGLSKEVAGFVVALDLSIAAGALANPGHDLEKLIGRKPQSLAEGLRASLK